MKKLKNASKQIKDFVSDVNEWLKDHKSCKMNDPVFTFAEKYITDRGYSYHFGWFKQVDSNFNPLTGEVTPAPAHLVRTFMHDKNVLCIQITED